MSVNIESNNYVTTGVVKTLYDDLSGRVASRAPAIVDSTTGYTHGRTDGVTFIGNSFAWGNARYANAKNLIDGDTTAPSGTFHDVAYVKSKNGIILNGTCSSGDDAGFRAGSADIPAGTYKFKIEVHLGESVLTQTKGFYVDFWYDGNETTTQSVRASLYIKDTDQSTSVTLTNHVYKIRIWWGVKKDAVYSDYRLFYSLLPSDAVITDTQQTVSSTGTLDYTLPSAMFVVDTLMHESTATELIDTKQYVDNHTPDLVYLRPEDFGAKGDGSADDSAAIAACLAASRINDEKYLPVRGFGIYSVANPIVITGRHANVFFHQINYTGSDVAVKVSGSNNKIEFDYIYALNSNTAKGIQIDATGSTGFNSSELSCNRVRAASHAVYFASVLPNVISYNVFRFNLMSSGNGDIFHFAIVNQCNENVFYGEFVAASNGYFARSENSHVPHMKLYHFCLESDLKYGIKGVGARLHDCRTAEFMGQYDANDAEVGKLFNFSGRQPRNCMSDEFTEVNLQTVYTEDSMTYAEVLEEVEANFSALPQDATSEQKHYVLEPLCFRPCTFKLLNCLRRNDMQVVPYGEIIAYHNKKVIKLHDEFKYNPTGATFSTATEEIFPTFFDLADSSASVVSICLDDNYCWPGINKFKVRQYASIKAKVYDKNNTLIFDGTNEDAGIYAFECSFVRLDSLVLNLTEGRTYSVPLIYRKDVYTGENEEWTVTKLSVIEPPAQA